MNETRYPLSWPAGWKRTAVRKRAAFISLSEANEHGYRGKRSLSVWDGVRRIAEQMRLLKIDESTVIISTNVPTRVDGIPRSDRGEPQDPGAAVYWQDSAGKRQCMAIDYYDRVADNLAAVAATLEALRAVERHGGGAIRERTFQGFAQLPAGPTKPWREVLHLEKAGHVSREIIDQKFKELARTRHPDTTAGSHDAMAELNAARDLAYEEVRQ